MRVSPIVGQPKGFSLLELVVVMGIIGIMLGGMSAMMDNLTKSTRTITSRSDLAVIREKIRAALSTQTGCNTGLTGTGNAAFNTGLTYSGGSMNITQILNGATVLATNPSTTFGNTQYGVSAITLTTSTLTPLNLGTAGGSNYYYQFTADLSITLTTTNVKSQFLSIALDPIPLTLVVSGDASFPTTAGTTVRCFGSVAYSTASPTPAATVSPCPAGQVLGTAIGSAMTIVGCVVPSAVARQAGGGVVACSGAAVKAEFGSPSQIVCY